MKRDRHDVAETVHEMKRLAAKIGWLFFPSDSELRSLGMSDSDIACIRLITRDRH